MSANNQSAQGGDNHINLYEPHVWKHHTKVAGLEWKNPVGTASGTFQYAAVRWFYDVSQLGAVCTKGASPVPWEGNPSPRTAESPAANINAVGLQNPGIDHYLAEDLPKLKAEANVEVIGLVLSVDRMEKTKDSDTSAVKAVEAEFGFPVFAIANVKEIFEAGQHIQNADGTPYVTPEIKAAADAYLEQYGA